MGSIGITMKEGGLSRIFYFFVFCALLATIRAQRKRLPAGVDDKMIREKLNSVQHSSKTLNTGKSLFSKIREEDKPAADLAFKLFKLAQDEQFDSISLRQGESEFGVNSLNSETLARVCPFQNSRQPSCNRNDKFRTVDGSCNNLDNPLWGMSMTPMQRIAKAEYAEQSTPRRAKSGRPLPSPRLLTQEVLGTGNRRSTRGITTFFVQMGQFIDHDLTLTPEETEPECCDLNRAGEPWVFNENFDRDRCIPIEIPDDDRIWGRRGRTCFEVHRSLVALAIPDCAASPQREQWDALTHFLDSSNVYGSTVMEARDVRDGMLLKVNPRSELIRGGGGRSVLPACANDRANRNNNACAGPCQERDRSCKIAGDQRVNEQIGLTSHHTLWLREHNRLAAALESLNTHWNEERVFQEARRILIAQWQHIIYNEWLPILLGETYMTTFDLFPQTSGYTNTYNERLDPRINNEFATAAFRFGHSMMPTEVPSRDRNRRINRNVNLHQIFNNVSMFESEDNLMDDLIRGQSGEAAAAWDPAFNEDLVNRLFDEELDLPALNINRGRDHGIPGYNRYREICKSRIAQFGGARSFRDLTTGGFLTNTDVELLQSVYDDVDDIDLFVGATLEENLNDALLGPVFTCIIGDQFQRLKEGDRFYFENGEFPQTRFRLDQLDAIRKVTMARIVCDNTDLGETQPNVFRTDDRAGNRVTSCSDTNTIPELDLAPFRDL